MGSRSGLKGLDGSGCDWFKSFLSLVPQDEQKCVETVELGSYEKCQDLRALLKRKHRFILLRSPGNKVGRCLLLLPDLSVGLGPLAKMTLPAEGRARSHPWTCLLECS